MVVETNSGPRLTFSPGGAGQDEGERFNELFRAAGGVVEVQGLNRMARKRFNIPCSRGQTPTDSVSFRQLNGIQIAGKSGVQRLVS